MKQYDISGGYTVNVAIPYVSSLFQYCRKDAATLLLKFGAQPGIRNGKNESVIDIVNSHPERRRDDFMKLFKGMQYAITFHKYKLYI